MSKKPSAPADKPDNLLSDDIPEVPFDDLTTEELAAEINKDIKAANPELDDGTIIEPVVEDNPDEPVAASKSDDIPDEEPLSQNDDTTAPEVTNDALLEEASEQTQEEDKLDDDGIKDDLLTVKAIDEIVAQESDVVLEAEDQSREIEAGETEETKPKKKSFFVGIFTNKWTYLLLLSIVAVTIAIVAFTPNNRYSVLNAIGVRSSLSLKVIDTTTKQPIKNVQVKAGESSGTTNDEGTVKLEKVRLGETTLMLEKRAFEVVSKPVTVGWGSNPLGDFEITAVGAQYLFTVTDYVSGKPVKGVQVSSGDGNATSDADGKVTLTLDTANLEDDAQLSINFEGSSYRTEEVTTTAGNKENQAVELVPSRKHVFVSKRSGKYDVYSIFVDGKDEKKLVAGTGIERDDIALVPHQKNESAALIATRENVRNTSGYLLSTLYLLNTQNGELVKIDQSEQIQVIGWTSDGHLVYVKIAAGAGATDPKRHRLMSFNSKDYSDVKELAYTNTFNDVLMAAERVYYAPSSDFQEVSNASLFSIKPDGGDKQTVFDKEVDAIIRTNYDTLALNVGEDWYRYAVGSTEKASAAQAPSNQTSRIYADNADNTLSLWRISKDGEGVLNKYDKKSQKDTVIVEQEGLNLPLYWLGNKYAVYRVNDSTETADYIISSDGGKAKKITDVADSAGIGHWIYY